MKRVWKLSYKLEKICDLSNRQRMNHILPLLYLVFDKVININKF